MRARVGMGGDAGELNRWCEVFAADETAARKARWVVVSALREWGLERLVEDGRVVVSELVTNVFAHAGVASNIVGLLRAHPPTPQAAGQPVRVGLKRGRQIYPHGKKGGLSIPRPRER